MLISNSIGYTIPNLHNSVFFKNVQYWVSYVHVYSEPGNEPFTALIVERPRKRYLLVFTRKGSTHTLETMYSEHAGLGVDLEDCISRISDLGTLQVFIDDFLTRGFLKVRYCRVQPNTDFRAFFSSLVPRIQSDSDTSVSRNKTHWSKVFCSLHFTRGTGWVSRSLYAKWYTFWNKQRDVSDFYNHWVGTHDTLLTCLVFCGFVVEPPTSDILELKVLEEDTWQYRDLFNARPFEARSVPKNTSHLWLVPSHNYFEPESSVQHIQETIAIASKHSLQAFLEMVEVFNVNKIACVVPTRSYGRLLKPERGSKLKRYRPSLRTRVEMLFVMISSIPVRLSVPEHTAWYGFPGVKEAIKKDFTKYTDLFDFRAKIEAARKTEAQKEFTL